MIGGPEIPSFRQDEINIQDLVNSARATLVRRKEFGQLATPKTAIAQVLREKGRELILQFCPHEVRNISEDPFSFLKAMSGGERKRVFTGWGLVVVGSIVEAIERGICHEWDDGCYLALYNGALTGTPFPAISKEMLATKESPEISPQEVTTNLIEAAIKDKTFGIFFRKSNLRPPIINAYLAGISPPLAEVLGKTVTTYLEILRELEAKTNKISPDLTKSL